MARLKKDQKNYILQNLAEFVEPKTIIQNFKDIFGIDLTYQQIESYNPSRAQSANLSDDSIAFFNECRRVYLNQPIENIPGANDYVQLEILSNLLMSKRNNVKAVIDLVDQIQKITKGFYEKRRIELTGADGQALPPANQNVTYVTATQEQIAEALERVHDKY